MVADLRHVLFSPHNAICEYTMRRQNCLYFCVILLRHIFKNNNTQWDDNVLFFLSSYFRLFVSFTFLLYLRNENIRGLFDMYCVLYDISKAFDSNSQMDFTSLQSILRDLKNTISFSDSISEMRHGTLI